METLWPRGHILRTSDMEETLFNIIARAASPRERFVGTHFQPLTDYPRDRLEAREETWIRSTTGGDRHAFAKLLEERGLDWKTFRAHIPDVTVRRDRPLPDWGQVMQELLAPRDNTGKALEPLQVKVIEDRAMEWPYDSVFHPFLQDALTFLTGQIHHCPVPVTPHAMAGMLTFLARRLEMVSIQIVMHECSSGIRMTGYTKAKPPVPLYEPLLNRGRSLAQNWLDLFDVYPVLGRMMSVILLHWKSFIDEFLTRLGNDDSVLAQQFRCRRALGALDFFEVDPRGLTYNGGRTVTMVGFSSGCRAVYKPKDLRSAAAFMALTRILNAAGPKLPLHTRVVIARKEYAWEEYVSPEACLSPSAVRRFYFRMGMLLRLLQILQARDIGMRNIMACGEYPAVLDLETLFYPSVHAGGERTARQHAAAFLNESPLETGMLPLEAWAQFMNVSAQVLSPALNPAGAQGVFGVTEYLRGVVQSRWTPKASLWIADRDRRASWQPILGDQPVDFTDNVPAILAGYRHMAQHLQWGRQQLHAGEQLLMQMFEYPGRYFYRTTGLYGRVLLESLSPANLQDGVAREISLERLWKAHLISPLSGKMIEQEIAALRQLDIPTFRFIPSQDILMGPDGTEIGGVLRESSLQEEAARVMRIRNRSLEPDLDMLRSAWSCIGDTGRHTVHSRRRFRRPLLPHRERSGDWWLDQAVQIGTFILRASIAGDDGGVGWVGLCLHPQEGRQRLEPLPPDLLSGTCGLALFFADLYRLSGLSTFKDGLDRTLVDIRREVAKWPDRVRPIFRRNISKTRPQIYCGAFYGLGSALYTLLRCARLPQYQDLGQDVSRCLQSLPKVNWESFSSPGVISGRAGLLISLLTPEGTERVQGVSDLSARIAYTLLPLRKRKRLAVGSFAAARQQLVSGLPGGELGIDLALLRWRRQETQETQDLIEEIIEKVLHHPTPAGLASSGIGRLLAGLTVCKVGEACSDALIGAVRKKLEADASRLSSSMLLERVELAVTGFQVTSMTGFKERACAYAEELIRRHENLGKWFPETLAADRHNLSAITGVAAIGHNFLKLQQADQVSSMRLLE